MIPNFSGNTPISINAVPNIFRNRKSFIEFGLSVRERNTGNIFATAADIEELEQFAAECIKVWKAGFWGERMYVEAAD